MLSTRFGVEIEFTGLTRNMAARTVEKVIGGCVRHAGTVYDTYEVQAADGRVWKVMRDGSINCQRKESGRTYDANDLYSCELVTPILTYEADIETLQEVIRALRKAGGFANESCGIHIHLDGEGHTVKTVRNFLNLVYARQDLLYRALAFRPNRIRYCHKVEEELMTRLQESSPKTMEELENVWYAGYYGRRDQHYHQSRYHFITPYSEISDLGSPVHQIVRSV